MTSGTNERGRVLARYIATAHERVFPPEVLDAARRAFVDYLGVSVGAAFDEPVLPARAVAAQWNAPGGAVVFLGARTQPAMAAFVNGTMTHAADYDDTHPAGAGHPSGPCWSTALALAMDGGADERDALAAFITGFEVMAKLGGGDAPGVGRSLQRRGLHPTSVFGRAGATATACVLLRLDEGQIASALGIAATSTGGLLSSKGTHGKPYHSGKSALDGILAAQLAANGFEGPHHQYELHGGLLDAFIQDREVAVPPLDFETRWELLGNGFKPYASCRATHASTQAARSVAERVAGRRVMRIRARVHPNALVTAGIRGPRAPLEAKFSVPFCIAMGLRGFRMTPGDFNDDTMARPDLHDIEQVVELEAVDGQPNYRAYLDIELDGGDHVEAVTDVVTGHPLNPMSPQDMQAKFTGLVEPQVGESAAARLFDIAWHIDERGAIAEVGRLLQRDT